jgi:hypothetical protein
MAPRNPPELHSSRSGTSRGRGSPQRLGPTWHVHAPLRSATPFSNRSGATPTGSAGARSPEWHDRAAKELRSSHVNLLTAFGLFAVSSMLVCYAFEKRSAWFILGFSVSCALGSAYGFLQGAWPFGLVEAIWSLVALQRWWRVAGGR